MIRPATLCLLVLAVAWPSLGEVAAPGETAADRAGLFGPLRADRETAKIAAVRERWQKGDPAGALKLLPADPVPPPLRFLRGRLLLDAGEAAAAFETLSGLADDPDLAVYASFYAGEALETLGRQADAAAEYRKIPPSSRLATQAAFRVARTVCRLGRVEPCRAALETAIGRQHDSPLAAEPLFLLGRLLLGSKGGAKEGGALLRRLRADFPDSPQDRQLMGEPHLAGTVGTLSPSEWARRGRRLVDQFRYDRAREAFREGFRRVDQSKPSEPLCRLRLGAGLAHFGQRRYTDALRYLDAAAGDCRAFPAVRAEALLKAGDALSRTGRTAESRQRYRSLLADHPDSPLADGAGYNLALTGAATGETGLFEEYLARFPSGVRRDLVLWSLAWIGLRDGDDVGARRWLQRILEVYPAGYDRERALYWLGRLEERTGQSAVAEGLYRDLVRLAPIRYYGFLAADRLADLGLPPDPQRIELLRSLASGDDGAAIAALEREASGIASAPPFRTGLALLRAGCDEQAAGEFQLLAGHDGLLAWLYAEAGDLYRSSEQGRKKVPEIVGWSDPDLRRLMIRLTYPRAWADLVTAGAARSGIPAELAWGVMREESAFRPEVLSPSNALGLMQLIEPTARRVARREALAGFAFRDLVRPEINIRLGTSLLGSLLREFSGRPELAAAAYNAGEGAVRRWLSERPGDDPATFVENIRYLETRGYAKRVVESCRVYAVLSGSEGACDADESGKNRPSQKEKTVDTRKRVR